MSAMHTYDQESQFALQLATQVGPIALAIQRGGAHAMQKVEKPDDGGPVTAADLELNARIVAALRRTFPGDAIVAEESDATDDRFQRERCWYIDPIDGTTDFSKGLDSWAIHIGLCCAHEVVFGLVYEPVVQRATLGITKGPKRGTYVSQGNEPLRPIRAPARGDGPVRALSSRNHACSATALALERLGVDETNHRTLGSTGVKIGMIARGESEIYLHPRGRTKLWDSCAPQALIEGSGGRLTGVLGDPIRYDQRSMTHRHGLLATAGIDHEAVVAILAPLASTWYADT
jgi:3'(2'), 5'-bisphosphate nucleotidase